MPSSTRDQHTLGFPPASSSNPGTALPVASSSASKRPAKRTHDQLYHNGELDAQGSSASRSNGHSSEQMSEYSQPSDEDEDYAPSRMEEDEDDYGFESFPNMVASTDDVSQRAQVTTSATASASSSSSVSRPGVTTWSEEEDALLIDCARKHNFRWPSVATAYAQRTKGQSRTVHSLRKRCERTTGEIMCLKKMPTSWSRHEDQVLLKCVDSHGCQWREVSKQFAQESPTKARTARALKERYKVLKGCQTRQSAATPGTRAATPSQQQPAACSPSSHASFSSSSRREAVEEEESPEDLYVAGSVSHEIDGEDERDSEEQEHDCVDFLDAGEGPHEAMALDSEHVTAVRQHQSLQSNRSSTTGEETLRQEQQAHTTQASPSAALSTGGRHASASAPTAAQGGHDSIATSSEEDYDVICTGTGFRFEAVPPNSEILIFSPIHFKRRRLAREGTATSSAARPGNRQQQRQQAAFVFCVLDNGAIEGATLPPGTKVHNARVFDHDGRSEGGRSRVVGYETRFVAPDEFSIVFYAPL